MFKKILIANRGEIACRVIKTAKKMGILTVAVYSDADKEARHVELADEAVHIGASPSRESYLVADKIIAAAKSTGAQAIHPGYGFLSENEDFARRVEEEGLVFIGPKHGSIAAMGDKIASKKLATEAGVNTIPGHNEPILSADEAVGIAQEIGYPVMIKASAGGGGKGLRVAFNDKEAFEGFTSCRNEARNSFGDDRVFIEKFVEEPRHIEIQVLGDAHGHVIHLGERECSIQRRHQKVIEEAPSPFLDAKTRAAMGGQAVALAKAVDYRSAGTVEFIVDKNRNFYFLEMNTRLQVEHPVTELVTGLDLVEWMIRIAAGETLPFQQEDIKLEGTAIEARIYAEDPLRNFLPSIGRLVRYLPPGGDGIRVDTGVFEGAEISVYYDPMIAKLVGYGPTRREAIDRLGGALDAFVIRGLSHNIPFLAALLKKDRFREGRLSTNFIAEEFAGGFAGVAPTAAAIDEAIAIAGTLQRVTAECEAEISGQLAGHRREAPVDWVVALDEASHPIRTYRDDDAVIIERAQSRRRAVVTQWRPGLPLFCGTIDGAPVIAQIDRDGIGFRLTRGGATLAVKVLPPRAAALLAQMPAKQAPDLSRYLLSPMPGLLVSLAVGEGQEVKAGEELAVVEAMKMENVLRAERDGKVKAIRAKAGDSLAVDQVILEFA